LDNLPDKPPAAFEETDLVMELLPGAVSLLEKDFQTSGIDAELSGRIVGDLFDLRDEIAKLILKTGGPGAESFYRLLYRADIPEAKTREALTSAPERALESVIAEMLIVRALQKAYFRKKFSS
jgi:hypothetical protein